MAKNDDFFVLMGGLVDLRKETRVQKWLFVQGIIVQSCMSFSYVRYAQSSRTKFHLYFEFQVEKLFKPQLLAQLDLTPK